MDTATIVDLLDSELTPGGPIFGHETEDLDLTALAWAEGRGVGEHTNTEVDVAMIVLSGRGVVQIGEQREELSAGQLIVLPKGLKRSITALTSDFRYLNVHKRRRRLMPTLGGRPKPSDAPTP
ncbi:cupin domain-containing protein [bacterium]|nr:MAG: cupin domain-containing protein [bacterium]